MEKKDRLYESYNSFCTPPNINTFTTEQKDGTYSGYVYGDKLYLQGWDKIEEYSLMTNRRIKGKKKIIVEVKDGSFTYNV
jgi:hypothetical protein